MDYLSHFGLHAEPFSHSLHSRFYFASAQHSAALSRLMYIANSMKGLAVLVGDIGHGKTTLARRLLDMLPEEEFEAALMVIVHAGVTADWLLRRIALQLGIDQPAADKLAVLSQVYQRLVEIHQSGKKAVLLIDEAQMMASRELMEEFRGLLNLEVPGHKLITFIFFGLPEIENNLRLDPPLAQRVALRFQLKALATEDTKAYVLHRLTLAGAEQPLFSDEALQAVYECTRGVPRIINTLCDNVLLEMFFSRKAIADPALVESVAKNLNLQPSQYSLPAEVTPQAMTALPAYTGGSAGPGPAVAAESVAASAPSPPPTAAPATPARATAAVAGAAGQPSTLAARFASSEPELPIDSDDSDGIEVVTRSSLSEGIGQLADELAARVAAESDEGGASAYAPAPQAASEGGAQGAASRPTMSASRSAPIVNARPTPTPMRDGAELAPAGSDADVDFGTAAARTAGISGDGGGPGRPALRMSAEDGIDLPGNGWPGVQATSEMQAGQKRAPPPGGAVITPAAVAVALDESIFSASDEAGGQQPARSPASAASPAPAAVSPASAVASDDPFGDSGDTFDIDMDEVDREARGEPTEEHSDAASSVEAALLSQALEFSEGDDSAYDEDGNGDGGSGSGGADAHADGGREHGLGSSDHTAHARSAVVMSPMPAAADSVAEQYVEQPAASALPADLDDDDFDNPGPIPLPESDGPAAASDLPSPVVAMAPRPAAARPPRPQPAAPVASAVARPQAPVAPAKSTPVIAVAPTATAPRRPPPAAVAAAAAKKPVTSTTGRTIDLGEIDSLLADIRTKR